MLNFLVGLAGFFHLEELFFSPEKTIKNMYFLGKTFTSG